MSDYWVVFEFYMKIVIAAQNICDVQSWVIQALNNWNTLIIQSTHLKVISWGESGDSYSSIIAVKHVLIYYFDRVRHHYCIAESKSDQDYKLGRPV